MNDKEKIEEVVKFINEIMAWRKTEEHPHGVQSKTFARGTLEEIKNMLGKSSSVEKLEAIKKVLDDTPIISPSENIFEKALVEITKILEK